MAFVAKFGYDLQIDQFIELVEAVTPEGFQASRLPEETDHHPVSLVDAAGNGQLRVRLYNFPDGEQGESILGFMYGLKDTDGVEVLPVALPGDALPALTRISKKFEPQGVR